MSSSTRNAGEKLADEIQHKVETSGALPGSILESEQGLRASHETGRSVLRQAVRILEARGVVKMRRGQGGGLVVQQPGPESAARTLAILIESELDQVSDIRDLLRASDNQIFTRAVNRLTLEDCRELRALATHLDSIPSDEFGRSFGHRTLLDAIRRAIPDPALALAQWTCLELGIDLTPRRPHAIGERTRSEFWTLSVQSLEAMISADISRLFDIRLRQYRILEESAREWPVDGLEPELARGANDYAEYSSPKSRADLLTREILRDARQSGWNEGSRLGGAEDLMERYGVSLLVLRQAIRVLEECGAVRMLRGRNGGLFIARPSRDLAVRRAVRHLQMALAGRDDAVAFLTELLLTCLSLARGRASTMMIEQFGQILQTIKAPFLADLDEARRLCIGIAELSRNPALRMFVEVLVEITAQPSQATKKPRRSVPAVGALLEMQKSLLERDRPMARRGFLEYAQGSVPK